MSFDISLNFFLAFAGLALLLCVTLNIALPGPGDPQTFRRNIARDHGTGASHGPVTHLHGSHKYRIRTGADTVFVAPVEVGDGAMTGAGSVITGDVPPEGLGIARARQRNIEGYAKKKGKPSKSEEEV